jgi:putative oxidoreductase
MKFLDNYQEQTYALMRIVTGFLFIWHGSQKFFNYPSDYKYDLDLLLTTGGIIELVGGILVMIGLMTRPVAFICSGTMAVAYWKFHGLESFFPIVNKGEIAALYCFVFLYIAARGAGIWSIDKR